MVDSNKAACHYMSTNKENDMNGEFTYIHETDDWEFLCMESKRFERAEKLLDHHDLVFAGNPYETRPIDGVEVTMYDVADIREVVAAYMEVQDEDEYEVLDWLLHEKPPVWAETHIRARMEELELEVE